MTAPSSPRPNGFSEATGEICYDLPSSYIPHRATGLLHLPRFLAKARKHIRGELPKSYQRNFCKGFDRFLCLHLGVEPSSSASATPPTTPTWTRACSASSPPTSAWPPGTASWSRRG